MNQYDNLLQALLDSDDKEVTITTNVGVRAVRKGLKKSLDNINSLNAVMEMPTYDYAISISEHAKNKLTIALVDPSQTSADNKFTPKFDFEIVSNTDEEPTEDSS